MNTLFILKDFKGNTYSDMHVIPEKMLFSFESGKIGGLNSLLV